MVDDLNDSNSMWKLVRRNSVVLYQIIDVRRRVRLSLSCRDGCLRMNSWWMNSSMWFAVKNSFVWFIRQILKLRNYFRAENSHKLPTFNRYKSYRTFRSEHFPVSDIAFPHLFFSASLSRCISRINLIISNLFRSTYS